MSSIVTQRFIQCHNYLKSQGTVRSSRQFAISLDYAPQSLSDILKGKRDVPLEIIRKMVEKYGVNSRFILEGQGEILSSEEKHTSSPIVTVVTNNELEERIAYVPIAAQAGYGHQIYSPEYMRELPAFSLPGHHFSAGTHRCFDISGDSMEPTLYAGDQVVCSLVEKTYWATDVRDNNVYVIVTDSSVVIKRVINKLATDGLLILKSDNTFFDPYELQSDEIKEVWKVTVKISPFMSSPGNLRNALHEEISLLKDTVDQQSSSIKTLNSTIELLLRKNRAGKIG